jgi:hypothetical protein
MTDGRTSSGSPNVVGLAEVAEILGISRQRASELGRRSDFPPARPLRAGPVWWTVDVRAWARTRRRKTLAATRKDAGTGLGSRALPQAEPNSSSTDLPELSGQDLETYSALSAVEVDGPKLARLYLEAHQLAAGGRATDPLALAAHDIRDVLMRLHQAAATPGQSYVEVSRTAYHQLRDAWEDAREALAAFRTREEAVDDPTDRFLSAAERLLGVSGPLQAKKAKVFDDFLNKSDPARHLVPQTARRHQAERWDRERTYFNALGHHESLTDVETLRSHIASLNELVLAAIRPRPFDAIAELDAKIEAAEFSNSDEDVVRAMARMTIGVEHDYFFQKISSPVWLDRLRRDNWFALPPETAISGATEAFAAWLPAQYLERVAALRPQDVLEVCRGVASSTNPRVRYSVLKALLAMPPKDAAGFTKQAARWAGQATGLTVVARALADYALHLANGAQPKAALSVMRPLLSLGPVAPTVVEYEGGEFTMRHDPVPRYEPYEYRQIVRDILPAVVASAGLPAFTMLSRTLASAIAMRDPEKRPPRDGSTIWRPTIDNSEDNLDLDALDALIDAVRDAGNDLLDGSHGSIVQVRHELERAEWTCHRRILVHLACRHADADPTVAVQLLMDRSLLHDYAVDRERDLLARECYRYLSIEQRTIYLGWIDQGPNRDDLRRRHAIVGSTEDVDKYVETSMQNWQRDRLSPLMSHLPTEWQHRLQTLIAERGEPAQEPLRVRTRIGSESPIPLEELRAMTVSEVAAYLKSWSPLESTIWGPSREGLATQFQQLVQAEATRFAEGAAEFTDVAPDYRSALLSGLRNAADSGTRFNWSPVLTLAETALTDTDTGAPDTSDSALLGRSGSWSRQEIGRLVQSGLRTTPEAISPDATDQILRILTQLLHDDDPPPDDEHINAGMSPLQRGINSVRGHAVELSLDAIRWASTQDGAPAASVRHTVLAELGMLLRTRLGSSTAVRAIFGLSLAQLIFIDHEWVVANRQRLLPNAPTEAHLRDAAWTPYLAFNRVSLDAFEILRQEYDNAVDRLALSLPKAQTEEAAASAGHLGGHLLALYNHGTLSLADGSLFHRFFVHAPVEARQHVLSLEARSMYESKTPLDSDLLARMTALWEHRVSAARDVGGSALDELKPFAWSFASDAFDPTWRLEQLNRILAAGVHVEAEHLVAEQLVHLASSYQTLVLSALQGMVRNNRKPWGIAGWIRQAGEILDGLDRSSDPAIVESSGLIRNELGAQGFINQLQPRRPRAT